MINGICSFAAPTLLYVKNHSPPPFLPFLHHDQDCVNIVFCIDFLVSFLYCYNPRQNMFSQNKTTIFSFRKKERDIGTTNISGIYWWNSSTHDLCKGAKKYHLNFMVQPKIVDTFLDTFPILFFSIPNKRYIPYERGREGKFKSEILSSVQLLLDFYVPLKILPEYYLQYSRYIQYNAILVVIPWNL